MYNLTTIGGLGQSSTSEATRWALLISGGLFAGAVGMLLWRKYR